MAVGGTGDAVGKGVGVGVGGATITVGTTVGSIAAVGDGVPVGRTETGAADVAVGETKVGSCAVQANAAKAIVRTITKIRFRIVSWVSAGPAAPL